MSEDSLTTLMWVANVLLIAWVPVAALAGKGSGASLTILVEALIIACIIVFEVLRRWWKCSR